MKSKYILICSLVLASLVSGCKTLEAIKPEKPVAKTINEQQTQGLATQTLGKGECGVFLWTMSEPKTFVYFQNLNSGRTVIYHNQKEHELSLSSAVADFTIGSEFDQKLTASFGDIDVSGILGDDMKNGRRISKGTITIKPENDWVKIMPVSGVYACQKF